MGMIDDFAKAISNYFFDTSVDPEKITEINTRFIDLYVSIIKRMAIIDGDLSVSEQVYFKKMEARLFDKNDPKLQWTLVPDHLYEKAKKHVEDLWENPLEMSEILLRTDDNLPLRKDLFEIACITAGQDHKFVKMERRFLDLLALEFKISEQDKNKFMKLHHLR